MDLFAAMVLGIIQGLVEWLPLSSEAAVTLSGKFLFGMDYQESLGVAVFLHLGTLLSAAFYFRNEMSQMLRSIFSKTADKGLLLFLLLATLLSGIVAMPLLFLAFSMEIPDGLFTALIGLFLIFIAFLQKKQKAGAGRKLELKNAIIPGLAQGFSALPGISRSGITLAALLGEKFPLRDAFRLSFLMSIPIVFAAELMLPVIKQDFLITNEMLVGACAAAAAGFLSISALLKFAETVNFFRATLSLGALVLISGLAVLFL
ncbi:MAG: undecaprenyl-diphosphate phosphatase [Candidatus ainarchaeum sp.]|nr:undecaprenyl-diphosphate phosphatase [Candidatus ainarchaeum sp.]MDD5096353.1 undecaprenyl-diphosphate phosphatase [Candidatus ainarchaeum sp.]